VKAVKSQPGQRRKRLHAAVKSLSERSSGFPSRCPWLPLPSRRDVEFSPQGTHQ